MELSNRDWQVLQRIANGLLSNLEEEDGYYWTCDTLLAGEVELLKKIAK